MCGLLQRLTSRCAIFAQRAIVKTLMAGGRKPADNLRLVGLAGDAPVFVVSSLRCGSHTADYPKSLIAGIVPARYDLFPAGAQMPHLFCNGADRRAPVLLICLIPRRIAG